MSLLNWSTSNVSEQMILFVQPHEPLDYELVREAENVFAVWDRETRNQTWGMVSVTRERVVVRGISDDTDADALRQYVDAGLAEGQQGVARAQKLNDEHAAQEAQRSAEAAATASRLTDQFRA